MNTDPRLGIGGNNPPLDPVALLIDQLTEDHFDVAMSVSSMIEAADRLPAIIDDETSAKVGDHIREMTKTSKTVEAKRVDAKAPHLLAERTVDSFFAAMDKPLATKKKALLAAQTAYLTKKEDDERRAREAEAKRLRDEAEALAKAAAVAEAENRAKDANAALDKAVTAERAADKADRAAEAKPAELTRVRGKTGTMSLREEWRGEMTDRAKIDFKILGPYLSDEAIRVAINAAVRAGIREMDGARIWPDKAAR